LDRGVSTKATAPVTIRDDAAAIEVLERELARSYRIERALRDVGLALGTTLDHESLLRLILERTTEALDAERATLYLLEQRLVPGVGIQSALVSRVVEGGAVGEIALTLGQGIAGEVAATGRPANVHDAYDDPRFSRDWDERTGYRTRAVLAAPMRAQDGKIIGVIQVLNKRAADASAARDFGENDGEFPYFDEEDEALLQALATHAAMSIEQARLFQSILENNRALSEARSALEKKIQDLDILFALERAAARAATEEELALAILPEAARAVEGRTAYVVLADESGDLNLFHVGGDTPAVPRPAHDSFAPPSWRTLQAVSPDAPKIRKLRVKAGEGLAGAAIASGQVLVVEDVGTDPRNSMRISRALFTSLSDIHCPAMVLPLLDEHDRAFGALGVFRRPGDRPFAHDDIELLKLVALNASTGFQLQAARRNEALQERFSTIGSLLSSIMHDLKTPMTVIGGYVQMMSQEDDPGSREEMSELVLRQLDHISAMQKEVLAFARGERSVLVRRVYLAQLFQELESQLEREIEARGSKVELTVDIRDRGKARLDESKITRAIHNLARNAIEAMDDRGGGKLRITVDREGETLIIRVADTGPGLPAEVEERLFRSFVTSGKAGGTGLGLAIVKKIAEDHGGTIEASSGPQGTTFTMRLPQPPDPTPVKRAATSGEEMTPPPRAPIVRR
jgi:signal transduction histidine kinase